MNASDPITSLPAGISESDLVDLADGCLAREREGVVLAAIKAEPRLGLLVKRMREDRLVLAEFAAERAPAGLAEGIESRLANEALRDLASASRTSSDAIPISWVRIQRPSVFRGAMESAWTRRLAMAASVALVAGLAAWGVRGVLRYRGAGAEEIANAKPVHEEAAPVPADEPAPIDLTGIDNGRTVDFGPEPALATAVAAAEPISDARAAVLAREGRLVVTIHAHAAQATIKRLETLVKASGREGWRTLAMDNMPAEYASLLTPSRPAPLPGVVKPDQIVVASDHSGGSVPSATSPPAQRLRAVVKAIYAAEVNPGDRWVAGLIRTITDAIPEGATLELRESVQLASSPVSVDPDSVLWWNAPAGKWGKKATVPIVVETIE